MSWTSRASCWSALPQWHCSGLNAAVLPGQLDDVQDMAIDPTVDRKLFVTLNTGREVCLEFQTLHDLELFR